MENKGRPNSEKVESADAIQVAVQILSYLKEWGVGGGSWE